MSLTFNLRHLEKKNLHLTGQIAPGDLGVTGVDEMVELKQPAEYDLVVERIGQNILVQGSVTCMLNCQCVRCLRPFTMPLTLEPWACDLPLEGEEKVEINNDCVDLTPYVREDILLAFPQHPLCEPDCRGLLEAGIRENERASVERPADEASSAWAALNKLKF